MPTNFRGRDFIGDLDFTKEEVETVLEVAWDLKRKRALGESHPYLRDKVLAMLFFFSSTVPRAIETVIAMGFAVDEFNETMSSYGNDVEREAPWPLSPVEYARIIRKGKAAAEYAQRLVVVYTKLADYLMDGRAALVVNHGGVLELGAVACLPNADHVAWGSHFDYCEGIRLFWDDGKFVNGEILRVST